METQLISLYFAFEEPDFLVMLYLYVTNKVANNHFVKCIFITLLQAAWICNKCQKQVFEYFCKKQHHYQRVLIWKLDISQHGVQSILKNVWKLDKNCQASQLSTTDEQYLKVLS